MNESNPPTRDREIGKRGKRGKRKRKERKERKEREKKEGETTAYTDIYGKSVFRVFFLRVGVKKDKEKERRRREVSNSLSLNSKFFVKSCS